MAALTVIPGPAAPVGGSRPGLAAALREETRTLHAQAERSGVIADILHGEATRRGYATLLRNLAPVYRALEAGLVRHRAAAGVRLIAWPALYRAEAIARDLDALGSDAIDAPLLPAGERFAGRVAEVAETDPARLIGHAYTRYLGDLSGGQLMGKLLARSLRLTPAMLNLYAFPAIPDHAAGKAAFRAALDRAGEEADAAAIIDEAQASFRLTIALSCATRDAMAALAGSSVRPA